MFEDPATLFRSLAAGGRTVTTKTGRSSALRGKRSRKHLLLVVTLAASAFYLGHAPNAFAGYAVQPSNGATTEEQPTFLVYLDSHDSLAEVYVSRSPAMSSDGFPSDDVGSCSPTTPFSEANKFTCQPGYYFTTGSSSLAPGTYYWWMSFWRVDPDHPYGGIFVSGPFEFTVAQPVAPAGTFLVSPGDGATVSAAPLLTVSAPANSQLNFYVSDTSDRLSDGSPAGPTEASCGGSADTAGTYTCQVSAGELVEGSTYYWWVVVTVDGTAWVYGPRSFVVRSASSGGGSSAGGSEGGSSGGGGDGSSSGIARPHDLSYAPHLPSSDYFTGKSVKQRKLSQAGYALSKALGLPKSIAVACWSTTDWQNISGDNPESTYSTLGMWNPFLPHWVSLSPGICRTFETLIYHRPKYANIYTSDALDTLTHEMLHSLGLRNEAQTECYAMQLSWVTGLAMGLPLSYAENLDRLSLRLYATHPPKYIDRNRCREDGAWDLSKGKPGLPWHLISL